MLNSSDTQFVYGNIELGLSLVYILLLYVFILPNLCLIMAAFFVRKTLIYALLSFMLVIMTKAVQEAERQQTNPQSSAGSSGTSNHPASLEKVHLASQTRFIRTANHGESRYFGLNEAEANSNARNRINSISRQRRGWKSTAENVEIRKEYLKNRTRQRQTNEVVLGQSYGSHLQTKNNLLKSHFTAEDHILQSKSHLARPIKKPTAVRANQIKVSIDHPNLVQPHKITQSQSSAFHKVQPNNNPTVSPTLPTRSISSNNDPIGSQDEQMAKHFGGWKVPSRKRKHE